MVQSSSVAAMTTNPASQSMTSKAMVAWSALDDLPAPDTRRWVVRRKAKVVSAVRAGLLTADEACQRYGLSAEEFQSWERALSRHGLQGLQATRIGYYRARVAPAADD
jgi:hypothetical protein